MNVEGESYEQWLARTAPQQPVRTVDPRTWGWGVIALLAVFFTWVWVGNGARGWLGLVLVLVLAAEEIVQTRMGRAGAERHARALRGGTLLVTMALSGWIIRDEGGVALVLPALLVLLDLKDDRSFLRWAVDRMRRR